MSAHAIRPGDTVMVRSGFGTEAPRRVTILCTDTEGARQVFDYIDGDGRSRWAYADQIEAVTPESTR